MDLPVCVWDSSFCYLKPRPASPTIACPRLEGFCLREYFQRDESQVQIPILLFCRNGLCRERSVGLSLGIFKGQTSDWPRRSPQLFEKSDRNLRCFARPLFQNNGMKTAFAWRVQAA